MHSFKVTTWPDETQHTIEVHSDHVADLHHITTDEAQKLLSCLENVLSGGQCEDHEVHHLDQQGTMFVLMLAVSDRHVRAYTVSKRKLAELKSELMGALNG